MSNVKQVYWYVYLATLEYITVYLTQLVSVVPEF